MSRYQGLSLQRVQGEVRFLDNEIVQADAGDNYCCYWGVELNPYDGSRSSNYLVSGNSISGFYYGLYITGQGRSDNQFVVTENSVSGHGQWGYEFNNIWC